MQRISRRSLLAGAGGAILASGLTPLAADAASRASKSHRGAAGHVYVLNNDLTGQNSVTVFTRASDGSLTLVKSVPIGGLGSVAAFSDGTQGSLILAKETSRLFAADAGSDQISVIDVQGGKLHLVGTFPSGGAGPVSLTYRAGLLYVLNAANGRQEEANVAGFWVDRKGRLHQIAGATRPLSAAHPNPAQVQIDPRGKYVIVPEKGTNLIDVYRVGHDGSLSAPGSEPSVGAVPFGLAFSPTRRSPEVLVVADAAGGPNGTGAATAYRLVDGKLHSINGAVPDHQLAPCWMVITRDSRFAYTSNANSQNISGCRIHANGSISLLDASGVTATTPADAFPIEEALSHDSRYLYVLNTRLLHQVPGLATLSGFRIHDNGSLSSVVDPAKISLPLSALGLAAD